MLDELVDGDLAQHLARALGFAHVALDQSGVGAADPGERLAGREVDDLVGSRLVYGSPQRRTESHSRCPSRSKRMASSHDLSTPTVVVAANSWNGRTPLTPSQGYFSYGASRSPSSRSRKPGMKNSFVSVVSITRPVWP